MRNPENDLSKDNSRQKVFSSYFLTPRCVNQRTLSFLKQNEKLLMARTWHFGNWAAIVKELSDESRESSTLIATLKQDGCLSPAYPSIPILLKIPLKGWKSFFSSNNNLSSSKFVVFPNWKIILYKNQKTWIFSVNHPHTDLNPPLI